MKISFEFDAIDDILLALCCLMIPLDWMAAAILAGLIHELCHVLAVFLVKGRIYEVRITPFGATMDISCDSVPAELICAAAGPIGSFSLLLLAQCIPKITLCGLIHGIYNLLPIYPLDGGRVLHCITRILFSRSISERITLWIKWSMIGTILFAALWGIKNEVFDLTMFIMLLILLSRIVKGKIPCKE